MSKTRLQSSASQLPPSDDEATSDDASEAEDAIDDGVSGVEWKKVQTKKKKGKYICKGGRKTCGQELSGKSIMCEACHNWFHAKCQDLSDEAFRALKKFDFLWLCHSCRSNFEGIMNMTQLIEKRIDAAEKRIVQAVTDSKQPSKLTEAFDTKLENMERRVIEKMREQNQNVEAVLEESKKTAQSLPKYTEDMRNSAEKVVRFVENHVDQERKRNLIFHNIKESSATEAEMRKKHDSEAVQNITSALLGEDVKLETVKAFRLGKRSEDPNAKSRLLLVTYQKKEDADDLHKKRFKLKEKGFANTYITRDLPPVEREKLKKLRQELLEKGKEQYCIFQGEVVLKEDRDRVSRAEN